MNPYQMAFQMLINMGSTPQQAAAFLSGPQGAAFVSSIGGGGRGYGAPGYPGFGGGAGGAGSSNPFAGLFGGGGGGVNPLSAALLAGGAGYGTSLLDKPYGMEEAAAQRGVSPEATLQGINQMTQPLNRQLINSVTRAVSPTITSRGLATSPGMSTQMVAEALAPYEVQEQQMGANNYWRGQEMPFQGALPQMAGEYPMAIGSYSTLLAQLMENL